MEQLGSLDASFFYLETPTIHMTVSALCIFDAAGAPEPLTFEKFRAVLEDRIHLVPTFRRRVMMVPFDMDRPYWVDDPDFDLDFHLRHMAVPPPGTLRELFTMFGRIVSRPMDRTKPLWEMYYIEGLGKIPGVPEGGVAWITKIHHSAIDGVSGIDLLTTMLDLSPEIRKVDPPVAPWNPPPPPTELELIARATGHRAASPIKFIENLPKTLASAANYTREIGRRIAHLEPPKALFRGPKTRLNCAITSQRRFSAATLSLDDVKEVRKAVKGATVNDAVLAVCAGGLRRYLDSKGELPEEGLVAMTPISVRADDDREHGNKISSMLCPLYTDADDPLERLWRIHEAMVEAKEVHGALGANILMDATNFLPSSTLALAARLYTRIKIADVARPFFNVVISNVPGPQIPLYAAGARLVTQYPSGPIVEGLALFIGVFSYCGQVTIGLTADRQALPDVDFLAECMTESMEELREAAEKVRRA